MRSHNFKDITGQRFGSLVAIRFVGVSAGKTRWECVCDCGATTVKVYQHMVLGLTKSCGCLRKAVATERMRAMSTTHGLSQTKWWKVWSSMMRRCYNTSATRYARYGGRGIAVCERWHDAVKFFEDMGEPPENMTIERVDNNGNYSPNNCRWASYVEQNNNRSTTKFIEFLGERLSGAQWARRLGISKSTLYARLKKWPVEQALTK